MASIDVHNIEGKVVGSQELEPAVFEMKVNPDVVHQVMVAQSANSRQVVAHTKIRSEVRGGGRKPWRQKGTGRARHGSNRSPIWRGGGITFGPRKDRNYTKRVNRKMKNAALRMVLSDKVAHERMIVVDTLEVENGRTSVLKEILNKLPVGANKVLVALGGKNENVLRAADNLAQVRYIAADSLNVNDLLKSEYFIVDQAGYQKIVDIYNKQ